MKNFVAGLMFASMLSVQVAQAGVNIVLDYSLDSNGFFTPERRAIAQAAADTFTSRMANTTWARVDPAASGGSYELAIINPSTMEVTWVANVVIPANQVTVRLGAMDWSTSSVSMFRGSSGDSVTQLLSIRNVRGAMADVLTSPSKLRPVDATISFDLQGAQGLKQGITRQWYFGSATNLGTDDRNPADPYYNAYTDFYTSLIHELGHVLGIYDPVSYESMRVSEPVFYNSIASDPNFFLAWTSRVQADGHGGYAFTGPLASQLYYNHVGQPIPLEADNRCHWAEGVRSQTAAELPSVNHFQSTPFRYGFSELEFAALADMGYTINSPPVALSLSSGWNLAGNSSGGTLDVATTFGDSSKVETVWKWSASARRWAFYTPSSTRQELSDYAASKGYEVLNTINGGEGFWVNAKAAFTLYLPAGSAVTSASFQGMAAGWKLIAVGDSKTPGQFNSAIGLTSPPSGDTPVNLNTLWAWDATNAKWYFYAPALDKSGGLANHINSRGYQAFGSKVLEPGMGFWVNAP